jgi:hypothetical protein
LDFVARTARKHWVFVIETKSLPFTRQGFIDDLLRLALLNKPGVHRYFLVAGELRNADWKYLKTERKKARGGVTGPLRVPFRRLINVHGKPRRDLIKLFLSNEYREKNVSLTTVGTYAKDLLASFQQRYHCKQLPGLYITELVSWSRKNKFIAVIWEIKIKRGRAVVSFLPSKRTQKKKKVTRLS